MKPTQWRSGLTIVTPSFEKHFQQFHHMIETLVQHCQDLERVNLIVVVERANEAMFTTLCESYPALSARVVLTEDIFADFGVLEKPGAFLKRIGKFTFQTLKKFGGLVRAETEWSLVLDSEGLFQKSFRAEQLLDDYRAQKYVFYTETQPRGAKWRKSVGYDVTRNAGAALGVASGDRWYMEYFHWFYETEKIRDLVSNRLGPAFTRPITTPSAEGIDFFENILYYLYLQNFHDSEYKFLNFKDVLDQYLPANLAARFKLNELPFALFGNEYLLNILAPEDIADAAPLFAAFKLPFVRLEPPYFTPRYLEELAKIPSFVATISSHHAIWLRKKIAVCISGEFRHDIHRVPEQHVRHLLGFLSGVDCDIYVHGWSNASEALILSELKPKAYKFESRPSFASLVSRIVTTEPRIKPGRDEGSLAMFYGMEEAYRLMEPNAGEYDYVLRIRPDIYSELSLKEIMVKISDQGDFLPGAIYVPRQFHSKGINDQIALGPTRLMGIYAKTFSYIKDNIEKLFFNPESVLLRHLLENEIEIAVVDAPYTLLRNLPFTINNIHEHFHRQFGVWWSRTDDLPVFENISAYFADKLCTMDAVMRETLPDPIYLRAPAYGGGVAILRARVIDNDPALAVDALFDRLGCWVAAPFVIEAGSVRQVTEPVPKQIFVFPDGSEAVTIAEWRKKSGRFTGNRISVAIAETRPSTAADAGGIAQSPPAGFAFASATGAPAFAFEPKPADDGPKGSLRFLARDLSTQDGRIVNDRVVGTFQNGRLFYGPYISLEPGQYLVSVEADVIEGSGTVGLKVTTGHGKEVLAQTDTVVGTNLDNRLEIAFDIDEAEPASDLEVICDIRAIHRISVVGLTIVERADIAPRPPAVPQAPPPQLSFLQKMLGYAGR